MKIKLLLSGSVAAVPLAAVAGPAQAAVSSIAVSPSSQTVASGSTAHWGWSWGGSGTYTPTFSYGDGGSRTYPAQTNGGSGSASRGMLACVTTTYIQTLKVGSASITANTRVTGGPCL